MVVKPVITQVENPSLLLAQIATAQVIRVSNLKQTTPEDKILFSGVTNFKFHLKIKNLA